MRLTIGMTLTISLTLALTFTLTSLCQEIDQDSEEYIAWKLSFGRRVPGTS